MLEQNILSERIQEVTVSSLKDDDSFAIGDDDDNKKNSFSKREQGNWPASLSGNDFWGALCFLFKDITFKCFPHSF